MGGPRSTAAPVHAPMLMSLSIEVLAYLIHALRAHETTYRRNGAEIPTGVPELVAQLSFGVTQGQPGPTSAKPSAIRHVEVMAPRLCTYETAAGLLDISPRTLKRWIQAGELHPFRVGGVTRIRVAEIDELIEKAQEALR